MALELCDREKAKMYADLPELDEQKRNLWLLIARNLLQEKPAENVKSNLAWLLDPQKSANWLQLDDLIPLLPKKVKLKEIKHLLSMGMEKRTRQLSALKESVKQIGSSTKEMEVEQRRLISQHVTVSPNMNCNLCSQLIFREKFYAFPCEHSFHFYCILDFIR